MAEVNDRFTWQAIYDDESIHYQIHPKTGIKSAYNDIARDHLVAFQLCYQGIPFLTIDFEKGEGSKLVWRRRVEQTEAGRVTIMHILGKKGRFVLLVSQDMKTVIVNNFRENDRWLDSPVFTEVENG